MTKVVIAGASGFVGRALINHLLETTEHHIVALSRSQRNSDNPRVEWRQCDLFSLLEVEKALKGCDLAYYLVHSMIPSARLTQGRFEDFDLLLADNFARACQHESVKQIVYLGGVLPDKDDMSIHIQSRLEVEEVLKSSGVPTTSLRAGLIIGPGGSSFTMMKRLVEKLPIMVCPNWTQSVSSPINLKDITKSLIYVLNNSSTFNQVYDLSCGENYSYQNLMRILSQKMGLKRKFISVNLFTPKLSRLWVTLVTGAPKNLVAPLVESLKSSMKPNPSRILKIPNYKFQDYPETLDCILSQQEDGDSPHAYKFTGNIKEESLVRSLQRFTLQNKNIQSAREIASRYFGWLPHFMFPFIRIIQIDERIDFRTLNFRDPLLSLRYSHERSSLDRQLFYICGGMLADKNEINKKGRLEFRRTLNRHHVICAIHDFKPRLPWYIYKFTQAIVHLFVMKSFRDYLRK